VKKVLALLLTLVLLTMLAACKDAGETADDYAGTGSEEFEKTLTAMQENGFVSNLEIRGTEGIDTTRKSTWNTDERLEKLTIYTMGEIVSWTPWQAGRGRDSMILTVFEPLFYYHDGYELEPCLAKSWEDEDDTHFVVEIYDYITDTDGNNLTASDVVAAYEYYIASGNASDFDFYESCEAIGDYTVRFTWKKPIDSVTAKATMLEVAIYTQKAFNDHPFTTDPVGTGAYYLDKLVTGSEYILKPNESYWQKDEALRCEEAAQNVELIDYKVISDSSMAYIAFQSGEIFNNVLSASNVTDFKKDGKYYGKYLVTYEEGSGRMGLSYNQAGDSIMNDINMRLAVAYAIDGDAIVEGLSRDSYYQVHGEAGAGCFGYNTAWDSLKNYYSDYDPDLAKEYLAKTSYNGEKLTLLAQAGNDGDTLCCQIIQQFLKEVGIDVELAFYEHAIIETYLYDLSYWDMWFFSWNGDPISQQWGRQFDMRNYSHGASDAGINDPKFQEMIERVQLSSNYSQELVDEIQTYITGNCMSYSLYGTITYTVFDSRLARLTTNHGHKDINWGACEYYLD